MVYQTDTLLLHTTARPHMIKILGVILFDMNFYEETVKESTDLHQEQLIKIIFIYITNLPLQSILKIRIRLWKAMVSICSAFSLIIHISESMPKLCSITLIEHTHTSNIYSNRTHSLETIRRC